MLGICCSPSSRLDNNSWKILDRRLVPGGCRFVNGIWSTEVQWYITNLSWKWDLKGCRVSIYWVCCWLWLVCKCGILYGMQIYEVSQSLSYLYPNNPRPSISRAHVLAVNRKLWWYELHKGGIIVFVFHTLWYNVFCFQLSLKFPRKSPIVQICSCRSTGLVN